MATKAEVAIAIKIIDKASRELDSISKSAKNMGKNMKAVGKSLTRNVTLPLIAVGIAAVKSASDMDTAMRNIQSITKQTDAEIKELEQDMLNLSTAMDTGAFSAVKYAEAQYDVNSAGFEGADALHILEISSRAATAGQAGLGKATDVTLTVLKAWNLEASEASRVNDVLFAGVRIGKQDFESLASGMKTVAPTFAAFGIPIEDATAALTLFANKGTDSAEAATQLKSIVIEMNQPTAELAALIKKAGFESGRQMLATVGSTRALELLNQAALEENVILADTFNNRRAAIGIMTLTGENMNELTNIQGQLANSTGELDAAFNEQAKSFDFQFKKMVASIQEVAIIIGQELIPIITPMIAEIKKAAEWFSNLDKATKTNIVRFGVFVAIVGPLAVIFGTLISSVATIAGLFTAVAASSTAAAVGTGLLNAAMMLLSLNPIGLAIAAIGVAFIALIALFPEIRQAVEDFFRGIGNAVKSVADGYHDFVMGAADTFNKFMGFDSGKKQGEAYGEGLAVGTVERVGEGMMEVIRGTDKTTKHVSKSAQKMGKNLKKVEHVAKGVVVLMSIARGKPNAGFKGADIKGMAADIKQQVIAAQGADVGLGGAAPTFGGGGMSLLDAFKSGDISEADRQQLSEILGGGGDRQLGGGGDINITIENLSVPAGTNEEQVNILIDAIADKLKKQGLSI